MHDIMTGTAVGSPYVKMIWVLIRKLHSIVGQYIREATFDGKGGRSKIRRDKCNQMQVWEVIDRPSNEKVIPTRWVDVNKGDEKNVKYLYPWHGERGDRHSP